MFSSRSLLQDIARRNLLKDELRLPPRGNRAEFLLRDAELLQALDIWTWIRVRQIRPSQGWLTPALAEPSDHHLLRRVIDGHLLYRGTQLPLPRRDRKSTRLNS